MYYDYDKQLTPANLIYVIRKCCMIKLFPIRMNENAYLEYV
jgi:hypothetical protein